MKLRPSSAPLVVWIVLDACRYDVFWETDTRMREAAARGLRLTNCISQGTWTFAAMTAVLTGRYSIRNGTSVLTPPEKREVERSTFGDKDILRLARDVPTVFSVFAGAGREVLSRGIRVFGNAYDYAAWNMVPQSGIDVYQVCWWLNRNADRPAFYFYHAGTTHFAWGLHRQYLGGDLDAQYERRLEADPVGEGARMRRLTEGGLRHFDETEFQPLVRELERSGRIENTVFVIHADHGDTFGEFVRRKAAYDIALCGRSFWHHNCWDETIHVPAAVFGAGVPDLEISGVTRQVDLLPTVLGLSRTAAPADLDGVNLLAPGVARPARAVFEGHWERSVSVQDEREKLVYNMEHGRALLFDRVGDPGDMNPRLDVPDDHPLWDALREYAGQDVRAARTVEEEAVYQRLRDLGYVD